jgi:hypothetical protein
MGVARNLLRVKVNFAQPFNLARCAGIEDFAMPLWHDRNHCSTVLGSKVCSLGWWCPVLLLEAIDHRVDRFVKALVTDRAPA